MQKDDNTLYFKLFHQIVAVRKQQSSAFKQVSKLAIRTKRFAIFHKSSRNLDKKTPRTFEHRWEASRTHCYSTYHKSEKRQSLFVFLDVFEKNRRTAPEDGLESGVEFPGIHAVNREIPKRKPIKEGNENHEHENQCCKNQVWSGSRVEQSRRHAPPRKRQRPYGKRVDSAFTADWKQVPFSRNHL